MTHFTQTVLTTPRQESLIRHGIWKEGCPVPLERLRLLTLTYVDFAGIVHHDGEMMVLDAVAAPLLLVFQELYQRRFPIERIEGLEAYQGNDELSMQSNNSSAFNYRPITGGGSLASLHSYGVAIDINPRQNPYIAPDNTPNGTARVLPPEGLEFLNRTNQRAGMAEPIVDIFNSHGFTVWGGTWNNPIDWQHFQPPRAIAEQLVSMEPAEAIALFARSRSLPARIW